MQKLDHSSNFIPLKNENIKNEIFVEIFNFLTLTSNILILIVI